MKTSFEIELTLGESFITCDVEASYTEPKAAVTHLAPEDCEPYDPGEFDLTEITTDGIDIRFLMCKKNLQFIEKFFWDNIYDGL